MRLLLGIIAALTFPVSTAAQEPATPDQPPTPAAPIWQFGGFLDVGYLNSFNDPANHLFRNRGTTPRVDEWDLDMAAAYAKKTVSEQSRIGAELTVQGGEDSKVFGFSPTAPKISGADVLRHFGPTDLSYLAPFGKGLTIQGGIFNSLIGYDSLYAKDNFTYTRPWGADYTPYLMLGVNAAYPFTSKLTGTFGLVNGYWHLAHANDVPSIAGQLAYAASDHLSLKETVLYGPHQPTTAIALWRLLSDTIVEHKKGALTVAAEYQIGSEQVDTAGNPRALWMAAQVPVHWLVHGPWSATVRPEFGWDRDGRWIAGQFGAGQSVKAITTTLEYHITYRRAQGIVRVEYRFDDSHGNGGGFYDDGDVQPGVPGLTPTQHLLIFGFILTVASHS